MTFVPRTQEILDLTWPKDLDHISASSIKMAVRCEEQWRQRYVKGRKEPPNLAMLAGFADHAAIEKSMIQKIDSYVDLPLPEVRDAYVEALEIRVEREGGIGEVKVKDAESRDAKVKAYDELRRHGQDVVSAYHTKASPIVQPIAVEQEFSLQVKDLPVTVDGRIDLVANLLTGGPGTRIIDRKRRTRASTKIEPEWSVQAEVYQLVHEVPHDWHISVSTQRPQVILPTEDTLTAPPRHRTLTEMMLQQIVAKIGFLYQRYGPDEPWPATGKLHPWACGYCGFKDGCWGWSQ